MRTLQRSRRRFRTARAAWMDIGKVTGLKARSVVSKAHTRTHWRFVVRR